MNNINADDLKLAFIEDTLPLNRKVNNTYDDTPHYRSKLKTDTLFSNDKYDEEYTGLSVISLIATIVIFIFLAIKFITPIINTDVNLNEPTPITNVEKVDLIVK